MATLEKAIQVAAMAHQGQVDKSGEAYILHPLRVMMSCQTSDERIVAMLHDVVEDTEVTLVELAAREFAWHIVDAVDALTRHDGEDYTVFIKRCKSNALARKVKIADIQDNLSPSRAGGCTATMRGRYMAALMFLEGC